MTRKVTLLMEKAARMFVDFAELGETLGGCSSVAILGAKDNPGSPVDMVGRYLIQAGFTVYPVHPVRRGVWGLTTYAKLKDIPGRVDIVDVFRASEYCAGHARETLDVASPPAIFWMQSGIVSPEARSILAGTGIMVVEDLCLMVEHRRLSCSD